MRRDFPHVNVIIEFSSGANATRHMYVSMNNHWELIYATVGDSAAHAAHVATAYKRQGYTSMADGRLAQGDKR